MYICTGSHFFVIFSSKGLSLKSVEGYLRKYQEESRKLSDTSVSLFASAPHSGHFVFTNSLTVARGDLSVPVGRKSSTCGSSTGRSFSSTATIPHFSQ